MKDIDFTSLKALYINCTLKKSPEESHTHGLMRVSMDIMEKEGVAVDHIRLVDHDVAFGVYPDMTEQGWEKDEWPELVKRVLDADILIIGTPIWLGEKSSVAQKLIERLYAMSGMQNDKGQYLFYGKVGGCVITGNEDGVKHNAMSILYALQHIGYSIAPQSDCGWLGEIGPGPSYLDKESNASQNDFTNRNTTFMTYNLLHLGKMLKEAGGYSAYGNSRKDWDNGNRWSFENPEYR
ncbi:flavodoxin family protein [Roseivirga seohaensis]|uniref:Flavodoxin n=1 Tax=Roseivirga seohaensis subsp. aquiponti TaxID=1566026 RepID=A0A0L8AIA6_9BACT|nr:flavodoxin family protein [Roseivirga seohaensis]KOF02002.1 flavodoxin [Roseivirga seohaensis subsp. aquiponti]|tara:strand:- start:3600 stop:4310 length:711 start_codon:yes stop_codon:yes gene_type:complete